VTRIGGFKPYLDKDIIDKPDSNENESNAIPEEDNTASHDDVSDDE
jgi:hypothetical protein